MTQKRKDLPQPSASNFQQRLREALQTYMGRQGDPLDRGITLRDLLDTGLAKLRDGATLGPGSSTPPIAPIPVDIPVYEADLTPPPQPDGFAVSAAISHVFIEHNPPTYTQGHGHLRTRVYGAIVTPALPAPVFGDAVEIAQFSGTIHAHPSNPATTWRLWIKWESADGVLSATPAGGTNGLLATTGEDVSLLLDALAGEITATELASSLATPIALINLPTTGIIARLDAQANSINLPTTGIIARLDAQTTLIGALQTEVATLSGTPDYAAGVTYATDDIVQYDGGLYRALSVTTGNLPTNATYWQKIGEYASLGDAVAAHSVQLEDHQTRIVTTEGGLASEVSARTLLASTVADNTAAISSEASTRATADTALASQVTTLSATVTSNNTTQGAAITSEAAARTTADEALATQITTLQATVTSNNTEQVAAVQTEASARASADSALATQATTLRAAIQGISLGQPLDQWALNGQGLVTISDGKVGNVALRLAGNNGYPNQGNFVPIDRSKVYRTQFWARPSADNPGGLLYFTLQQFTDTGTGPSNGGRDPYKPVAVLPDAHNAIHGAQQWGLYSYTWSQADWQAGVTRVRPDFLDNYPSRPGYWEIQGFEFTDVTATESLAAQITTEATARTTAIAAEAQARETLSATVNDNNAAQTAAVSAEATARANADGVNATKIDTVQASLIGGPNLLPNSGFDVDLTGWGQGWEQVATDNDGTLARDLAGATWVPTGMHTIGLVRTGTPQGRRDFGIFGTALPVEPGARYCASAFLAAHRCTTGLFMVFIGADGSQQLAHSEFSTVTNVNGGTNLADWSRQHVFATAPAGARYVWFSFCQIPTGGVDPYSWACRPQLERATAAQTQPSPWSPSAQGLQAAVQVEATARALQTGELYAQYTVKTDVAGLVSGYGLASSANNSAPTSAFGVRADKFWISAPTISGASAPTTNLFLGKAWYNTTDGKTYYLTQYVPGVTTQWLARSDDNADAIAQAIAPFVVSTTPTTINGVEVPPGVYIENAYMGQLVATRGQIGLLAVDDARIASLSADKITAGSIAVGQFIQSTSYVAGSAGWRINGDGTAEFSGVVVRGSIFASSGLIGGITIASNAVRAGQTDFNTGNGFYLGSDGRASFGNPAGNLIAFDGSNVAINTPQFSVIGGNATFSGSLSAASGSFSGSLQGATGTFSGQLLAGTVDLTKLVGSTTLYTTPGTYLLTVPAGFNRLQVTLIGGGGGGGPISGDYWASGGGGGGGYTQAVFTVSEGQQYTLTVGAGGQVGQSGGATTVSGLATAGGGAVGPSYYPGVGGTVPGGAGGSGTIPGSAGGVGGYRSASISPYTLAGGKGGNAGNNSGIGGAGATLTDPSFGAITVTSPTAGSLFGGGGGGGLRPNNYAPYIRNSMPGANGRALIEIFNANGVVIRSEWTTLTAALQRQNIQIV